MNKFFAFLLMLAIVSVYSCDLQKSGNKGLEPVALAYVYSPRSNITVDPTYITHINFAFGHVNETFNGIRIDNEELLKNIVELKKQKPSLKVLLSVGGWGSGRFSEMAGDEANRKAFAVDCQRVVKELNLDGIDLDWEYPTSSSAGISSSPDDTNNFTLLCRDIRKEIGKNKLLTFASASNARYVDFKAVEPYLDFVNIMTYDLENKRAGQPPLHQAGLYRSQYTNSSSVEEGVIAHLEAGMPPHKLVLGIPFGSKGLLRGVGARYGNLTDTAGYIQQWDDVAKAAWLSDMDGNFLQTYEEPRAIGYKCEYVRSKGLRGAMYWQYSSDVTGDLRKAVYEGVMKK